MASRKRIVGVGLVLVALVAPIRSDRVDLRLGAQSALAAECKPILICEGIDLGFWSFQTCIKVQITVC
jgi:hypothetical protein